jgi:hypothetical protein
MSTVSFGLNARQSFSILASRSTELLPPIPALITSDCSRLTSAASLAIASIGQNLPALMIQEIFFFAFREINNF